MTIVTEYDWQSDTFTHHTDRAAYSGRRLPLIPIESCHGFRSKPATPVWGIGAPRDADITPSVCCAFLTI